MPFLYIFKHLNPLLSAYFENPEQGLPLFIKIKSPESMFPEGQDVWIQTDMPTPRPKQTPSTCLSKQLGNLRMLVLDKCKIEQTAI